MSPRILDVSHDLKLKQVTSQDAMPPKKRKPSLQLPQLPQPGEPSSSADPATPNTPRKSRRIAGLSADSVGPVPLAGSSELERQPSGLSALSTQPEHEENWPELKQRAIARVTAYEPSRGDDDKLVACLLAFLDWLPVGGRDSLARDIEQCGSDEGLYQQFNNLRSCLISAMKAFSQRSSNSGSPIVKRQDNAETVAAALPDPETRDSKFRAACLRRDNYRCVVTGHIDGERWEELGEPEDVMHADLEASHIIPFSTATWNDSSASITKDVSNFWETLFRCFPRVRSAGMRVKEINHPFNGITLLDSIHKQFGKFRLAFVATDEKHVYSLKVYKFFASNCLNVLPRDRLVKFQAASDAEDISLPCPDLLDCHYRLAEVLNASGMARTLEDKINQWKDFGKDGGHGCLRADGTSNLEEYLSLGLWGTAGA
ncbi:hypothetical protein FQN54_006812 [Arachnomyces sp. PD_36]|nr:hypothetical protein FQN54_006812 [Arachnomyces sp. PD_36]